jgi:hypothetical protein
MIRIVVILAAFAVLEYHVNSQVPGFVNTATKVIEKNPFSEAACNTSNLVNSGVAYIPGLSTASPVQAGANRKKRDVKEFSGSNPLPDVPSGSAPAGVGAAMSQITAATDEN